MGELNKSVLGKVRGSVGDITFRQRNGKNYISLRRRTISAPTDAASVERRGRFAVSAKIAQAINATPLLKAIWEKDTPAAMSPYNNMLAVNFAQVTADSVTPFTTIIPSIGFPVNVSAGAIAPEAITVTVDPLGTSAGIDISTETSIQLIAILTLTKPVNSSLESMRAISFISSEQPITPDTALSFTVTPGVVESQLIESYGEKKALMALVTLDAGKDVVHFSNTFQR